MAFLIRRNRPKALAEWRDDFDRPDENPIQKPWSVWGSSSPHDAAIVSGALRFGSSNSFVSITGWSYEHTCFTKSWGVAFYTSCVASGLAAQPIRVFLNKPSWTRVNPNFNNLACLNIVYRTPGLSCQAAVVTFANATATGSAYGTVDIPRDVFEGPWHFWNIKVDDDKIVRVYLDGQLIINVALPAGYEASLGSRAANFQSGMFSTVSLDRFVLYDQYPPDPPWRVYNWAQEFYDDFNRANSSTVGNGWTQFGSGGGIVSNSYGNVSGTGGRGILRNSGITNGVQRVEATIGGADGPTSGSDSSLFLRMNSAGNSGLAANFFSNMLYVARLSGSIESPTMTDLASQSATFANGDKVAFCTTDDYAWVERNGVTVLSTLGANSVPASQSHVGARVEKPGTFSSNSHSWNDIRVLS
ncbi:virion structural protein [Gordonia phage Mayweather]|uniref:Uncharacterized protein n=1 Tax=Gordonia phage Mayweather TaxID=2590931 RepID=A0A516KU30_9CAUD|nr:virion structural protein [Gordonia phage Mayweather]QDP45190.1 hypothetical protein SEA_MAYWEATHER_28 [Gordonia phage Mayweather]